MAMGLDTVSCFPYFQLTQDDAGALLWQQAFTDRGSKFTLKHGRKPHSSLYLVTWGTNREGSKGLWSLATREEASVNQLAEI